MARTDYEECFYCGALVSGRKSQGDHFPIPKSCGGKQTVPCCQSCHDMKDRFDFNSWPPLWAFVFIDDFPKLRRETKLLFAKMISVMALHLNTFPCNKSEKKAIGLISKLEKKGYTRLEILKELEA